MRFTFRDPAISVAFGCWHADLDLVAVVTRSPNLKGIKFQQYGHFGSETFNHAIAVSSEHFGWVINQLAVPMSQRLSSNCLK